MLKGVHTIRLGERERGRARERERERVRERVRERERERERVNLVNGVPRGPFVVPPLGVHLPVGPLGHSSPLTPILTSYPS